MRIDFYVLADEHPDALKQLATRLLEKAYAKNQSVWVVCASEADARALDDWLWTNKADSFLPHCLASEIPIGLTPPIQIALENTAPNGKYDLLLNLTETISEYKNTFERILDVVAAEKKEAGRMRYKAYQKEKAALFHHFMTAQDKNVHEITPATKTNVCLNGVS